MFVETTKLFNLATIASQSAYVPYSNFPVGAAIVGDNGQIYMGCNVENASFGLTNCAERTAIFKAVSQGVRDFTSIAIYGKTAEPIAPCGACRQVMAEFCKPDMPVFLLSKNGKVLETSVGELLPHSFTNLD